MGGLPILTRTETALKSGNSKVYERSFKKNLTILEGPFAQCLCMQAICDKLCNYVIGQLKVGGFCSFAFWQLLHLSGAENDQRATRVNLSDLHLPSAAHQKSRVSISRCSASKCGPRSGRSASFKSKSEKVQAIDIYSQP